jgi:hypothetical protein
VMVNEIKSGHGSITMVLHIHGSTSFLNVSNHLVS